MTLSTDSKARVLDELAFMFATGNLRSVDSEQEFAESKIHIGTTVSWKWQSGTATGKVIKVFRDRVTLKLNSTDVTKNGTEDNPAILIEQESGARVLKLASEVSLSSDYEESGYTISLSELEFAAATKKKNCVKGTPCQNTCIAAGKVCQKGITAPQKEKVREIKTKLKATIDKKTKTNPQVLQDEPTGASPGALNPASSQRKTETTPEERSSFMKARPESKSRLARAKKAIKQIPGAPPPHPEELVALEEYTGLHYGAINAVLRGNDRALLAKSLTDSQKQKYLEDAIFVTAALDALPPHDGIVYRGTALPKSVINKYKVGETVTEKGFTSTSTKLDVAGIFSDPGTEGKDKPVVYTIKSNRGRAIKKLSIIEKEEEVLFRPDSQFKILDKKTKKGVVHIFMEEV